MSIGRFQVTWGVPPPPWVIVMAAVCPGLPRLAFLRRGSLSCFWLFLSVSSFYVVLCVVLYSKKWTGSDFTKATNSYSGCEELQVVSIKVNPVEDKHQRTSPQHSDQLQS
ncbi:hypothetical protein QAD02_022586 [Eretmocerus hayati]|uniref:Uncharacterized protein n=1 Tax=Eretmocerus hayati TaxID=131215 RepID=A0ACC2PTQ7_9HYME|nr:hypothetical protein QAD02_022586 [Eretmocerus hayati]